MDRRVASVTSRSRSAQPDCDRRARSLRGSGCATQYRGVALQNQLFTLRGQQARVMRSGDHGNRRNNDANEQAEWQFPKPQKVVPDHAGKAWRSLLPIDPLTLLKASVTLPIMRSSSLRYAALNYGRVDSLPPLLRPASTCLVLATHGRPVFELRFGHRYSCRNLRTAALLTHKALHNAVFQRMKTNDRQPPARGQHAERAF